MTKRRVIAYVDGFNFYYRRLRNKPYRWLDLYKFFTQFFADEMAVNRGKTVLLLHPDGNPSRSLERSATGVLHIHDAHLKHAQFPDEILLPNGKVIRKPETF